MQNRQLIFSPRKPYNLVAERSEANPDLLAFPIWWTILQNSSDAFRPARTRRGFGQKFRIEILNLKTAKNLIKISARTTF